MSEDSDHTIDLGKEEVVAGELRINGEPHEREKEKEKEKEREGEKEGEQEKEKEGLSWKMNIYFGVIWVIVIAVMLVFIVQIAEQYNDSNTSPSTIITYSNVNEDILPMVTICNWNQYFDEYLDYSDLTLVGCTDYADNSSDCSYELIKSVIPSYDDQGQFTGYFNCFQFNNDRNNPAQSKYTGYSGSYSSLFVVVNPPENDALRIGLQVSLTEVGVAPDVYGEDKFAPSGFDTYYACQAIVTVYNNYSTPLQHKNFTSTSSMTTLTRRNNDTHSYISVSWAFQTLNEETISYTPQYTLNNFFGDFAGMVGTLMGLDVVKVSAGFIVAIQAWKQRNIFPLQEHFNG